MKKIITTSLLAFGLIGLVGCGGGGDNKSSSLKVQSITYTGELADGVINSGNMESLAQSAKDLLGNFNSTSTAGDIGFAPIAVESLDVNSKATMDAANLLVGLITAKKDSELDPLPIGATIVTDGPCGGSMTETDTATSGSVTFNDYCEAGITINGTMSFTLSTEPSGEKVTITANNISFSDDNGNSAKFSMIVVVWLYNDGSMYLDMQITAASGGVQVSMRAMLTCDEFGGCTEDIYLTGTDGKVYWFEDASSWENLDGSIGVAGGVYHPDYGSYSFEADDITYCSNGNIASGYVYFDEWNGIISDINFLDCSTMEYSLDSGPFVQISQ